MQVLAILNLTPDSFSDGKPEGFDPAWVLHRIETLFEQGADFIDIGAESTRPGAQAVDQETELTRLLPVLEALPSLRGTKQSSKSAKPGCWIASSQAPRNDRLSLDSRNPQVIAEIFKQHGEKFAILNDVTGLQNPELLRVVADHIADDVKLIAMHSRGGVPPSIKASEIPNDFYEQGLLEDFKRFWLRSIELCGKFGIDHERLILDPGLGFGKNLQHSLEIVDLIPKIKSEFGLPVLIGASRKSFLKLWKNNPEASNDDLDLYTKEYNQLATEAGADYFRNHY